MTYPDQVRAYFAANPGVVRRDWQDHLKTIPNRVHRQKLSKALGEILTRKRWDWWQWDGVPTVTPTPTQPTPRSYPSGLSGFRELYDMSVKVPAAIDKCINTRLKSVGWMYDEDFRRATGVSSTHWRKYRDQYDHLLIKVEGRLIWGHPDIIDEMRDTTMR